MDFFMPFCTKPPSVLVLYRLMHTLQQRMQRGAALVLALILALVLVLCMGLGTQAQAQTKKTNPSPFSAVRFDASDDGIRMSGTMHFDLSKPVRDTLHKGVAVYFMLTTQTTRKRWYWSAEKLLSHTRYMRLTYQPITRRWRLNVSRQPLNRGMVGVLLNQNYNSLEAALAVMRRISSWQVLQAKDWSSNDSYNVQVTFQLDVSQLRRPMQIGTAGQSGWRLKLQRNFILNAQKLHTQVTP